MEADISILRKPGHFYFALTRGERGELFISAQNARFKFVPTVADITVTISTLPLGGNRVARRGPELRVDR